MSTNSYNKSTGVVARAVSKIQSGLDYIWSDGGGASQPAVNCQPTDMSSSTGGKGQGGRRSSRHNNNYSRNFGGASGGASGSASGGASGAYGGTSVGTFGNYCSCGTCGQCSNSGGRYGLRSNTRGTQGHNNNHGRNNSNSGTHGRIFGDNSSSSSVWSGSGTSHRFNGNIKLPDNILRLGDGRFILKDTGLKLDTEELIFILDNTIAQDKSTQTPPLNQSSPTLNTQDPNSSSPVPTANLQNSSNEQASSTYQQGSSSNQDFSPKSKKLASESSVNNWKKQIKFRNNPTTPQEQLLVRYTQEIMGSSDSTDLSTSSLARSGASAAMSVTSSTAAGGPSTTNGNTEETPDCSICLNTVAEESLYQSPQDSSRDIIGSVSLLLCGHQFHASCLLQLATHSPSCLACPNCHTIHGVRTGTQPVGGSMIVSGPTTASLPGHKGAGTLSIEYDFTRSGVQGPEHPHPGQRYYMVAFPRVAYVPDTTKGRKVVDLLRVAFNRRLVFTVGTSATSGADDCVVWNDIHHKTEWNNIGGHGYPDPHYLDNVIMELANYGVTEDDLDDEML